PGIPTTPSNTTITYQHYFKPRPSDTHLEYSFQPIWPFPKNAPYSIPDPLPFIPGAIRTTRVAPTATPHTPIPSAPPLTPPVITTTGPSASYHTHTPTIPSTTPSTIPFIPFKPLVSIPIPKTTK